MYNYVFATVRMLRVALVKTRFTKSVCFAAASIVAIINLMLHNKNGFRSQPCFLNIYFIYYLLFNNIYYLLTSNIYYLLFILQVPSQFHCQIHLAALLLKMASQKKCYRS